MMWFKLRLLVGFGAGVGAGIGVIKSRSSKPAEAELIPPPKDLKRLHNCPYITWDQNWDRRAVLKKGKDNKMVVDESKSSKARLRVLLINDCHHDPGTAGQSLTAVGKAQAQALGQLLQQLHLETFDSRIVHSPMLRSQEQAKIVSSGLGDVPMSEMDLLADGLPAPRIPLLSGAVLSPLVDIYEDNARMEAAFRVLFHRPDPSQNIDSYNIVLAHPNIIRFFVCRALQFPPEAYTRFTVSHGSLTWIDIYGNGRVSVSSIGDTGYLTPDKFTIGEIEPILPVV